MSELTQARADLFDLLEEKKLMDSDLLRRSTIHDRIREKRSDIREMLHEKNITMCGVINCVNEATHTWSGHPTCDDCATPARKGWTPPNEAHELIELIREQIGWVRAQIGPQNADRINAQLDKLKELK